MQTVAIKLVQTVPVIVAGTMLSHDASTSAAVIDKRFENPVSSEFRTYEPAGGFAAGQLMLPKSEEIPSVWTNRLKREFDKLALAEAEQRITKAESRRLEQLMSWRRQLVSPPSPEEIEARIRRDKMLEKLRATLDEYLTFANAENQKGKSAR